MDPLSDLLSLLRPRSYMFRGMDMAGKWSLRFPANTGFRCFAVHQGECWLNVAGEDEPILIKAGDCVLSTKGQSLHLTSDTNLVPLDAIALVSKEPEGGIAVVNGGGEFSGIGGYFAFSGRHAAAVLSLLPAVVHIEKESDKAALRWSIEMLMQELREPRAGAALMAQHLGHMMLVLALRLHLAKATAAGDSWLSALADKQIGAAINAMHGNPAHNWTLKSLADRARMSRSTFALRFKQSVGEAPMEYLARWRMALAGDKLLHSQESLISIAISLGYESSSAFSAAFRRIMGCSPRQYARSIEPVKTTSSSELAPREKTCQ